MGDKQKQIKFDVLKTKYAEEVASLHVRSVDKGFISLLGEKVVKYLYEGIIVSEHAFGFVVVKNSKVVGFISCTESVGAIYKYILKKHFFRLALAVLPKMFRLHNVKNAIETLLYPRRYSDNSPSIEILSVVVDEQMRMMGLGRRLIEQVLNESNKRGIKKIKVMVGEPLAANQFYKNLGFQLIHQHRLHGHLANYYVKSIGNNKGS